MIKLGYLNERTPYDENDHLLRALSHINISFAHVVDTMGTVKFTAKDKDKLLKFVNDNP